ncbi:MAG: glycoside-pentoside-hexuronide (GPH):cation symporter [Clostridia bacterium]
MKIKELKSKVESNMAGSGEGENKKYITLKEFISYPLGMLGFATMLGFVNTYASFFFTDVLLIPLSTVSIMFLVTRLFDAFNDPIMGILVDRTNTKFGKLRPYVLISGPILMLAVAIMFMPFTGFSMSTKIIIMYATYLAYGISITLAEIPANGMATVATPNEKERANFITVSSLARSIGTSVPLVIVTVLLFVVDQTKEDGTINSTPYTIGAIVCAVVGCAAFLGIFFNNKERLHMPPQKRSFFEDLKSIAKNTPFLLYVVACLLGLGRSLGGAMIQAYVANTLLGGAGNLFVLAVPSAVGSILGMIVARWLLSKMELKKVFLVTCFYAAITQVLMYGAYKLTDGNIWVFFALYALSSVQWGAVALFPQLFCADGVDYSEWQTGRRSEGATIAIFGWANKAANAVASSFMLLVIAWTGYSAELLSSQSVETQGNMLIVFTLVPAAFNILSAIPMFFYGFAGEKRKKILAELSERRKEQNIFDIAE